MQNPIILYFLSILLDSLFVCPLFSFFGHQLKCFAFIGLVMDILHYVTIYRIFRGEIMQIEKQINFSYVNSTGEYTMNIQNDTVNFCISACDLCYIKMYQNLTCDMWQLGMIRLQGPNNLILILYPVHMDKILKVQDKNL